MWEKVISIWKFNLGKILMKLFDVLTILSNITTPESEGEKINDVQGVKPQTKIMRLKIIGGLTNKA